MVISTPKSVRLYNVAVAFETLAAHSQAFEGSTIPDAAISNLATGVRAWAACLPADMGEVAQRALALLGETAAAKSSGKPRIPRATTPRPGGPSTRDMVLELCVTPQSARDLIAAIVAKTGKESGAVGNAVRSELSKLTRDGQLAKLPKNHGEDQRYQRSQGERGGNATGVAGPA